tara:strand:+ start:4950 stop:5435 length:486 start_codon:yes stop_codon:yes gene_type:complete
MPVINTQNKIFMLHRGVTIFHDYKEADCDVDSPMTYFYALNAFGEGSFDVRELTCPESTHEDDHKAIISAAIDSGELNVDYFQVLDEESDNALSQGQIWLLTNIHNVTSPTHIDDIPNLGNIDTAIFVAAEDCDTPEEVLSKKSDIMAAIEKAFSAIEHAS